MLGVLLVLLAACSRAGSTPSSGPPELSLIQEWDLRESDSLFVGRPGTLETTDAGTLIVTDIGSASVIEFDRRGSPRHRFGNGRGKGPGELIAPVAVAVSEDRLAVEDAAMRRTTEFSLSSGAVTRSWQHPWDVFSLSYHDGALRGAIFAVADTLAVMETEGARSAFAGIPSFARSNVARALFRHATISNAVRGEFVIAYPGLDSAFRYISGQEKAQPMAIPATDRRGMSGAALLTVGGPHSRFDPDTVTVSWPIRTRLLADGTIVILYLNPARDKRLPQLLVTAILANGKQQFVDVMVPVESAERPVATLTDSSVILMEQLLSDDGTPRARVREYRLPGR